MSGSSMKGFAFDTLLREREAYFDDTTAQQSRADEARMSEGCNYPFEPKQFKTLSALARSVRATGLFFEAGSVHLWPSAHAQ